MGLVPQSARALAAAGIRSLSDLADATRERLLAIPGVGPGALQVLAEILDQPLPRRRKPRKAPPKNKAAWPEDLWRKRGLPPSAALTFAIERMTLERLSTLSHEDLLAMPGVGRRTLEVCELMIGHQLTSRKST